jgi:hypothetical protein
MVVVGRAVQEIPMSDDFVKQLKDELGLMDDPGALLVYEFIYGIEPIKEAARRIKEREEHDSRRVV